MNKVLCGLIILPLLVQAADNSWTNTTGGAWETGGNWSLGVAPSYNANVNINNASSKTVTISASTQAANLTITNLLVEAAGGATNTLLLSGNTAPLTCLGFNPAVYIGKNAGTAGALVLDNGWLAHTNSTDNSSFYLGYDGLGVMTVNSGTWQGNKFYLGYRGGGQGVLNLIGGSSLFSGGNQWYAGTGPNGTGIVWKSGGLLVTTNAASGFACNIGNQGVGLMTVSGGLWIGNDLGVGVQATARGELYLEGGTNVFNGTIARVGSIAGSKGNVYMNGGLLVTTNAAGTFQFYVGLSGVGEMAMSNGTWLVDEIRAGNTAAGKGTLVIAGGEVSTRKGVIAGPAVAASNNTVLITGGLLEANSLTITAGSFGNVISNSGAVYQFSRFDPTITPASGSIVLDGGTIAFRGIANANVKYNWTGNLKNMTFLGDNAFRLNAATNATTPNQSYTFDTGLGSTNYTRLEMVNGYTCYRTGNVTLGGGGAILFSNTTALLTGSLTNNAGTVTVADSAVTIEANCTLAEGSSLYWSSNAVSSRLTVNGVLTVPAAATFTLTSPIGKSDQMTLFESPNAIVGSPDQWTVASPATHKVTLTGNTILLVPRSPAGTLVRVL